MVNVIADVSTIAIGDTINYARSGRPRFGKVFRIVPAKQRGRVMMSIIPLGK